MKKIISVLGLSVVIVLAGAAMFANASQNDVVEEGVLGVQEQVSDQVVQPKSKAESAVKQGQSKSKLTVEEAIAVARQHAAGTVKEVELDKDDGRLYYEIEMKDDKYEYELDIDAYTGDVIDFEKDLDD